MFVVINKFPVILKLTLILKTQILSPFLVCRRSRDISVYYLEDVITSAFVKSNNPPSPLLQDHRHILPNSRP